MTDYIYIEQKIGRANELFIRAVPPPNVADDTYQLFTHFVEQRELELALGMFIECAMKYESQNNLPLRLWQELVEAARELQDAASSKYCQLRCKEFGSEPL